MPHDQGSREDAKDSRHETRILPSVPQRPVITCLCGSTRFGAAFRDAMRTETLAGKIVLSVGLLGHEEGLDMDGPVKAMLDALHLRKIDLADEVLILNVDGYVGSSTLNEHRYAVDAGKPIRWLEEGWFWSRVKLAAKDSCWEWGGPRLPSGYGTHDHAGGGYAHRFAFEHATGVEPGDLFVLHRCDNPPCVNPDHLFLGTQAENIRDMWEKGRGKHPVLHGESNGRAKLTVEQVQQIRDRYAAGGVTYRQLAFEYGVHYSLIGYIVKGKQWKS